MQGRLRVTYGQNLEVLVEALIEELFVLEKRPFFPRLVVVPHQGMKSFLMERFASHPLLQVASGVRILLLSQAAWEIADQGRAPSFFELALSICNHLLAGQVEEAQLNEYVQEKARASALSFELAKLFVRYGMFAKRALPSWLEKGGWQQKLWKELYPTGLLLDEGKGGYSGKIALFGFSYVPSLYLRFFSSFNASCYLFSPCALFWEDLVSGRERLYLEKEAEKKGVSSSTREQLKDYMRASHPLLGGWGRLGREMVRELEELPLEEKELHQIPTSCSLLASIQRSILTLDETQRVSADGSIQIHSAPSKLREVEALRDGLETLLEEERKLQPSEILVLVPDLDSYAPLIRQVFEKGELPFSLEKGEREASIFSFLELPTHHFSLKELRALFSSSSFRERARFSQEEVDLLFSWFKQARIRFDLSGGPHSWEEGIDRLLLGLAASPLGSSPCIPHSEIDLFERFLQLFSQMKEDLALLGQRRNLEEWLELSGGWIERYFEEDQQTSSFFSELHSLRSSFLGKGKALWSSEDFLFFLRKLAEQRGRSTSPLSRGGILFSSFETKPFVPAKVIWCMGMDEESVPKSEERSSLCTMPKGAFYFPSAAEEDRFSFLEMVMKAEEKLVLSFVRVDPRDGKPRGPSLLVEELDAYVRKRGEEKGLQKIEHPASVFDAFYFSSHSVVKRWSEEDFFAARAFYSSKRSSVALFKQSSRSLPTLISISQLKKCARNPLQLYCNETMQLFLREEEDEEEADFILSPLKKGLLRKERHLSPSGLESQGQLPLGGFSKLALCELEEQEEEMRAHLASFGVKKEEVRSVHFFDCRPDEGTPLLRVRGERGEFSIQGELEGVSEEGLLFHGTLSLPDLFKVWPLYLIYLHLKPRAPCLLSTKEGKRLSLSVPCKEESLHRFLSFYIQALNTPCPLILSSIKKWKEEKVDVSDEAKDPYWEWVKRRGGMDELKALVPFWQPHIAPLILEIERAHDSV